MLGLRFVAKLYDVPAADGAVTAFDSHEHSLFVGTELGFLQKFVVRFDKEGSIFTTHVRTEYAVEKRRKVARIVFSSATDEVFVLSARKLVTFDADLNRLHEICTNVGVFSVSVIPNPAAAQAVAGAKHNFGMGASSPGPGTPVSPTTQGGDTSPQGTAQAAAGQQQAPQLPAPEVTVWHRICAAEKHDRGITVLEYNRHSSPHSKVVQQLLLPESATSITESNGIMCVGLQREYSMVSVKDGDAKSLLALNGRAPVMALGEQEVFLRLHNMIFVVSVRHMPNSKSDIVRKTIPFNCEPSCLAVKHPYVFALSDGGCEVYSTYEGGVIESLPVTECVFVTQRPTGDNFFAAGRNRIWMLQTNPLQAVLKDLVDRYKVTDAFDLLSTARHQYQSNTPSHKVDEVQLRQFVELEIWLKVVAGYAELYHANPQFALGYFNDHIDVREVLCHIPDLMPPHMKGSTAAEVLSQKAETASNTATPNKKDPGASADGCSEENLSEDELNYLHEWQPQSEHCTYHANIEIPWTQAFYELAPDPASAAVTGAGSGAQGQPNGAGTPSPNTKRVYEGALLTLDKFLKQSWTTLKLELIMWLQSRLPTAGPSQRRAIEFALLVLFLQAEDFRSAWQLLLHEKELALKDARPVLEAAGIWRGISLLLLKKNEKEEANKVWDKCVARCDPEKTLLKKQERANASGRVGKSSGIPPADEIELEATAAFLHTLLAEQETFLINPFSAIPGDDAASNRKKIARINTNQINNADSQIAQLSTVFCVDEGTVKKIFEECHGDVDRVMRKLEQHQQGAMAAVDVIRDVLPHATPSQCIQALSQTKGDTGAAIQALMGALQEPETPPGQQAQQSPPPPPAGGASDVHRAPAALAQAKKSSKLDLSQEAQDHHDLFFAIDSQCISYVHDILRDSQKQLQEDHYGRRTKNKKKRNAKNTTQLELLKDRHGNTPLHVAVQAVPQSTTATHYDLSRKLAIVHCLLNYHQGLPVDGGVGNGVVGFGHSKSDGTVEGGVLSPGGADPVSPTSAPSGFVGVSSVAMLRVKNEFGMTPVDVAMQMLGNASERQAVLGVLLASAESLSMAGQCLIPRNADGTLCQRTAWNLLDLSFGQNQ